MLVPVTKSWELKASQPAVYGTAWLQTGQSAQADPCLLPKAPTMGTRAPYLTGEQWMVMAWSDESSFLLYSQVSVLLSKSLRDGTSIHWHIRAGSVML